MKLLVFVLVLFSCFGYKYSYFDTSIIVPGIICLAIIIKKRFRGIYLPYEFIVLEIILFIILIYSSAVVVTSNTYDLYLINRCFRAILSTLIIFLALFNCGISAKEIFKILFFVLLLHACFIIIQIFFPESRDIFVKLNNMDYRAYLKVRAFGLTNGFDSAGYLCVLGAFISTMLLLTSSKNRVYYFFEFIIFIISSIFTSRLTILLMGILLFIFSVLLLKKRGTKFYSLFFLMTILFLGIYLWPIIASSITLEQIKFNVPSVNSFISEQITGSYYKTNINSWKKNMWVLPDSTIDIIKGVGINPNYSDVGYIKLIYMIGIIGLFMCIAVYIYILYKAICKSKHNNYITVENEVVTCKYTLIFFITLQFFLNIKILYFISRSFYEITIILFLVVLLNNRKQRRKEKLNDERCDLYCS